MLNLDNLDDEKHRAVRRILRAETFGVNEVDVQQDGTIFLNGYFTPRELELITQVAACCRPQRSMH